MTSMAEDRMGQDYIFGRNNVLEALRSERQVDKLFVSETAGGSAGKIITLAAKKRIPIIKLPSSKFNSKFPEDNHQGIAAQAAVADYAQLEDIFSLAESRNERPFIIIADEIADPHNLGAIIRTAECFGAHGVVISKRRAAGLTASVAKAAGGALNYLPVVRVSNLASAVDEMQKRGVWIFCCDMDGEKPYYSEDYDCALALVVGSEGRGVSALLKKKCDFVVNIPMHGRVSCLNASVAAAVVMQEIAKNR